MGAYSPLAALGATDRSAAMAGTLFHISFLYRKQACHFDYRCAYTDERPAVSPVNTERDANAELGI